MKVFGRILSIVGWLLVFASFAGGMLNFTFPTLVPGFILLFFGRVIRSAQKTRPIPESTPVEVPRHTQQPRTPAQPQPRRPPPQSTPPPPDPKTSVDIEEIMAEIEYSDPEPEPLVELDVPVTTDLDEPMSSAEMIARARSRWDRKD